MEETKTESLNAKLAFKVLLWALAALALMIAAVFVAAPLNVILLIAGLALLGVFVRKTYLIGTSKPPQDDYNI